MPIATNAPPAVSKASLARARRRVLAWFAEREWKAFRFQRQTWDAYLDGGSGLIHATTGTGKTYAAWLGPVIDGLAEAEKSDTKSPPPLRVLWITPLRALAGDTAAALGDALESLSLPWLLETRTGDTSAAVRNRQRKRLPTVLVTTPESLTLLLTRDDVAEQFRDLRCVVVDEWHELLGSKRGTQAELALARLRRLRPGLRVWGLSATLGNLDVAMGTLLGPRHAGDGVLISAKTKKNYKIDTALPPEIDRFPWAGHLGTSMVDAVVGAVEEARTTIVFTNVRSAAELWYQAILKKRPDWAGLIAVHHGSLDGETRGWVEAGLKAGKLKCVVSTSSLDLGVDFSPVDRVLQVGSPKSVARLLQRAGRSGHRPGESSRVTGIPTNALELIEFAACRDALHAGFIESREPFENPTDVLVQHAVTVAVGGGFARDSLLEEVRETRAFADLTAPEWDWVLDFVTRGGEALRAYEEYRRVVERDGSYVVEDRQIARRHKLAIGTITADEAVDVCYTTGGRIGQVEESFVSKLNPGDCFIFAGRVLEFVRVRDMKALVKKATKKTRIVPRWGGGRMPLSGTLSEAIRRKLDEARRDIYDGPEMRAVRPILETQAAFSRLPAVDELLIEKIKTREGHHLFVYPFAGRLVHEGLAALCAHRIASLEPATFTMAMNDYGFELLSPTPVDLDRALAAGLFDPAGLEDDIWRSLNAVEMAKRQFRDVARIAGLVQVGFPGAKKTTRQLQATTGLVHDVFAKHDPDNLLLKQSRDEVLERQLERDRLRATLERIGAGGLAVETPRRLTPLAFPLMVDRLREKLTSEKLADRVAKMTLQLEAAATTTSW